MSSAADETSDWSDVLFADGDEKTVSYRTAMVVYEESLVKGQFVGRGWNGSGYISFYDGRLRFPVTATAVCEADRRVL